MIPWLLPGGDFPPTTSAQEDPPGLLAAGGDLSPERLLRAYSLGIFPWYDADHQPILWWSPAPRCIFTPDTLHLSRSLRRHLNRTEQTFTLDRQFDTVMRLCAAPRSDGGGSWISEDMCQAYQQLHTLGYAHSLEVWQDDELAGAIYGIKLGGVFFGESMVSPRTNGSKSALAALACLAPALGIALIDAQVENPHLMRLGARLISRQDFEQQLASLIPDHVPPEHWPRDRWQWSQLQPLLPARF
ncbi:leucyl/phenylalanyl-tRNA--protein transferase [Alcanivorax hongdengensis A-11-3]|uniref:Leucyl/phenylalanyl-tRNA--protein transferase n=1 Tax=Alcanivorax hongdengensis A-11-3 TaxID=1177179 RepID=L0WA27_9GAMM|nr:leucyl/phenylalanyl-tRNA--protein transferase [Alcanivorax hongdengensis]EKF73618.1 leucyl/phenylalanyl-tRNA--protein transferase [Alcanivorax hongdengensis A-11-3]